MPDTQWLSHIMRTLSRSPWLKRPNRIGLGDLILTVTVVLHLAGNTWLAPVAAAQVNIEAQRQISSDSGFSGTLAADFELRTGNVEHFRLGIGGRVDYATRSTTTFLVGRGRLGLVGTNRFNNTGLVHLRHGWLWQDQLITELFAQVNYDEPRRLAFRTVAGGGLRLRLTDTESAGLWVASGYMFEYERLDLSDTASHPRTTSVHRLSGYLTGRLNAGDLVTLLGTVYAQPQIDEPGDFRLLSEMSLGISITQTLSVTIGFGLRWDSRPPDDVASLDTELTNGIAVAF